MKKAFVVLVALVALVVAAGCKKSYGADCQKLQACCTAIKADNQYAATSAWGLCDSYMSVMHNDENLCHGTRNDAKSDVTKAGKTPPAACD